MSRCNQTRPRNEIRREDSMHGPEVRRFYRPFFVVGDRNDGKLRRSITSLIAERQAEKMAAITQNDLPKPDLPSAPAKAVPPPPPLVHKLGEANAGSSLAKTPLASNHNNSISKFHHIKVDLPFLRNDHWDGFGDEEVGSKRHQYIVPRISLNHYTNDDAEKQHTRRSRESIYKSLCLPEMP